MNSAKNSFLLSYTSYCHFISVTYIRHSYIGHCSYSQPRAHMRPAMALASLRICAVSPEPSLLAHRVLKHSLIFLSHKHRTKQGFNDALPILHYIITQKIWKNRSFRNRENLPKVKTAHTVSLILHEHAHLILCVNWRDEMTGSEDIDQRYRTFLLSNFK